MLKHHDNSLIKTLQMIWLWLHIFHLIELVLVEVVTLDKCKPFFFYILVQLAGIAKASFSAKDYSDHMALVRAYEGWKDAEREGSAYEYCWRNFLSAQTLQLSIPFGSNSILF